MLLRWISWKMDAWTDLDNKMFNSKLSNFFSQSFGSKTWKSIFLFITVIWKVEKKKSKKSRKKKRENERLNLKNHFFGVFPKLKKKVECHDFSKLRRNFDLCFRIRREKFRSRMEKRRAYFFRASTLSFL